MTTLIRRCQHWHECSSDVPAVTEHWDTRLDLLIDELIEIPRDVRTFQNFLKSLYEDPFGVHLRAWQRAVTELRIEGGTIEFQEPSNYGASPRIVAPAG